MRIIIFLLLFSIAIPISSSYAGFGGSFALNETDTTSNAIYTAFDLRDRETFVQVTNQDSSNQTVHVQIYNVANLCNENDFFDLLTPNDTHVYNLRDISTNDGSPSGVVLPEDAYGIIFIAAVPQGEVSIFFSPIFGNFRIIDNSGYEYRSNAQSFLTGRRMRLGSNIATTFNFNSENGVVLSDVFGIPISTGQNGSIFSFEANIDDVLNTFFALDVDIIDNNEVVFSCRDVIFACIDENSPLQEELIQIANSQIIRTTERSSASVARFEYGINEAIPHSKGGELLCPGNVIPEGFVSLNVDSAGNFTGNFAGYVGLNNGNGRASMDAIIAPNIFDFVDL